MAILLLILSFSVYHNASSYMEKNCIEHKAYIVKIGQCDYTGLCKVGLSNKETKEYRLPMLGEEKTYYKCK